MKKTFTQKLILIVLVLIAISRSGILHAQACVGDQILTSQAEVDALTCTSITGNLIIEGADITDLNPLVVNNGFNLLSVTGDVILRNCPMLTSTQGLDLISTVGGIFSIENCPILNSLGDFSYTLTSCNEFSINNCPLLVLNQNFGSLTTINTELTIKEVDAFQDLTTLFPSVTSVPTIIITENAALAGLPNFPNLQSTNSINISFNHVNTISGFTGLTNVTGSINVSGNLANLANITGFPNLATISGALTISSNDLDNLGGFGNLQTVVGNVFIGDNFIFDISAFNNLNSVKSLSLFRNESGVARGNSSFPVGDISGFNNLTNSNDGIFIYENFELESISGFNGMTSGSRIQIHDNANLTTVSGFASISSVVELNAYNNAMLSSCCWILDIDASNKFINNNAAGCASLAEIGAAAPTLTGCAVSSVTLDTDPGSCSTTYNINAPTPSDDCGVALYTYGLTTPQNSVGGIVTGGQSLSLAIPLGINTLSFTATDGSSNVETCTTTITVQDNQFPEFLTDLPGTASISTSASSCEGDYSVVFPAATDNCEIINREITVFNQQGGTAAFANYFATEGTTYDFSVLPGVYDVEVAVYDDNNFADISTTVLTVVEDQAPQFTTDLPADLTINTNPGECFGTYTVTFPAATDNCEISFRSLEIFNEANSFLTEYYDGAAIEGMTYDIDLPPGEYYAEAHVEDGTNSDQTFTSITVMDMTAPVITSTYNDITVACDEQIPAGPTAGVDVFSSDACDGDLSSNISISASVQPGSCDFNQAKEVITYSIESSDFSGNLASETYTVTILNDQQVSLGADFTLCGSASETITASGAQGTFEWSTGASTPSITVSQAGTYAVTVTGTSGCCTIDQIVVNQEDLPNASATGGLIGCASSSIQLSGSSTTPGVSFSWTGPGGFTSNMQNPTVSSIGEYTLTVSTPFGCMALATASVEADTDVPNLSSAGGTIDCATTEVQLMANSTTAGVTFGWSGPGNFTSDMQNPTVSQSGMYSVTVTAGNGCTVTSNVEVEDDTEVPNLAFEADDLDCINTESNVSVSSFTGNPTFSWTGPNGFGSSQSEPTINVPGTYIVTVTGENACTQTATLEITQDIAAPDLTATGGMIDCSSSTILLAASSTTPDVEYLWEGPEEFSSNLANPVVGLEGTYTIIVTSPNGCTSEESVVVTKDENIPAAAAEGGTISCENASIQITSGSETVGVSYSWSGPNGFTSDEQNPTVSDPGLYTVSVMAENGCSAVATAQVLADLGTVTDLQITAGELDCANNTTALASTFTGTFESIAWSGPDGFTSSEQNPIVPGGGVFTVSVTSSNGCVAIESITTEELVLPQVSASGSTLTCDVESVMISGTSTTAGVTVLWSGPGGFTSTAESVQVSETGTYIFTVTSENGCSSAAEAIVLADANAPDIQVSGGNIDCNNSEVSLMGSSSTAGVTSSWSGPSGFASDESNPTVTLPGTYTFTVVAENGCEAKQTVVVEEDTTEPEINMQVTDFDCEAGTLTLDASNESVSSYLWSGPNGFASDQKSISISDVGDYSLTVTGLNGCVSSAFYTQENSINYLADITTTPDTSSAGGSAQITITGGTAPYVIQWDNGEMGETASGFDMGEHSVQVTDSNGCTFTFDFVIDGSTNVNDIDQSLSLKIYPNPVTDLLTIDWESDSSIKDIQIYTLDGSSVHQSPTSNLRGKETINLSGFNAGTYLIRITSENSIGIRKFVKI